MSAYALCVDSDSASLMLTKDGIFVVPANCSAQRLVHCITSNLEEAAERIRVYKEAAAEEETVVVQCAEELGLISLEREDGVCAIPNVHEAVETFESAELPAGSIGRCHRSGWRADGRVIRPALVGVVRSTASGEEE